MTFSLVGQTFVFERKNVWSH